MDKSWPGNAEQLRSALNHLESALELLDVASAPAQIGAYVDLAINRLQDALPANPEGHKKSDRDECRTPVIPEVPHFQRSIGS